MKLERQQNLLGETVLTIQHEAMKEPIIVTHEESETAYREMKRLFIIHSKEILRKYVSVAQNSRGAVFSPEQKAAAEYISKTRKYIRQYMPLDKFQDKLSYMIPLMDFLMSRPQSRFYPSQSKKRDFISQATAIDIEEPTNSEYVHI